MSIYEQMLGKGKEKAGMVWEKIVTGDENLDNKCRRKKKE